MYPRALAAALALIGFLRLGCDAPAQEGAVRVGDGEAKVRALRGEPTGRLEAFGETVWLYPDAEIHFSAGRVSDIVKRGASRPRAREPVRELEPVREPEPMREPEPAREPADEPPQAGGRRVFIFLQPDLRAKLGKELAEYARALKAEGYSPEIKAGPWKSEAEIKETLVAARWKGLVGCVLIGDLPFARVRRKGVEDARPSPLYYMDLDGDWSKGAQEDAYTAYPAFPKILPEIWAGVIHAETLAGAPVEHLRRYLDRTARYRAGLPGRTRGALVFVDDEWIRPLKPQTAGLEAIYGAENVAVLREQSESTADRLRQELAQEREFLHVIAHGDPSRGIVVMQEDPKDRVVTPADIRRIAPKTLFYNFGNCSLARFTERDYAGGWFVFGPGDGLVGLGSTMTGMMIATETFYQDLSWGAPFGDALVRWYAREVPRDRKATEREWYLGVVLLGDPTLTLPGKRARRADGAP